MSSKSSASVVRPVDEIRLCSPSALFLVAAVAAWFLVSYLTDSSTPALKVENGTGWMGWFDQGEYYKTARDLAYFKLSPSFYWYGYPLIGALTYRWLPQHPFLIPDLFFVCGIALFFYAICRRFVTWPEAWLLTFLSFILDRQFWTVSLIWPWNSIPTYFAIFAVAWLVIFGPVSHKSLLLAAVCIGMATFCRPPDAPALLVMYVIGLLLQSAIAERKWLLFAPILTIGVAICLQLSAHLVLYGSLTSPYLSSVDKIGFNFSSPAVKLYQWLVDPSLLTGNTMLPPGTPPRGVIERLPHLLIALPGLLLMLRITGLKGLGIIAALVLTGLVYLSFNPTSYPPHYWSYNGFHYGWWFAPWVALGAWLTVTRAWRQLPLGIFIGTLMVPLGLLWFVSFQPQILRSYPVVLAENRTDSTSTSSTAGEDQAVASSQDDILQLTVPLRAKTQTYAVRIAGEPAIPFHASVAGSALKFTLTRDRHSLRSWIDYFPLGYPDALYLSFINAPLEGDAHSRLSVRVTNAAAARPKQVDLIGLEFKPGAAFEHWSRSFDFQPPVGAPSLRVSRLRSGWSQGGADYVWTIGPRALIELPTPQGVKTVIGLEIEASAFRPQQVTVMMSGAKAGQISVTLNERSTYRIVFPTPQPSGTYPLALLISNPTRPVDIGMNSDNRPLGIAIWRLEYLTRPETDSHTR